MLKTCVAVTALAIGCSGRGAPGHGTGPKTDGGDAGVTISLDDYGPPPPDARRDPVSTATPVDEFWTQGDAACPDGAQLQGSPATHQAYCYASDGMHGPSASWNEAGTLVAIGLFDHGKMEGVWSYFHPDGAKASQTSYHLGNQHGPTVSWYPDGTKNAEGNYLDGRPDGTFTVWGPDGKELGRFTMTDGTGLYTGWHDNGQKSFEQEMKFGQAHGRATSWHPNGQKASEMTFARDQPIGRSTTWDDQNRKVVEGSYAHGEMDGDWTYYDPDAGAIVRVDTYAGGTQVSSIDYQDGEPLPEPLPAQGVCVGEDGVRSAWTRQTGDRLSDEHGCLDRADHFGGLWIVGSFAYDRGCMTMGYLLDCKKVDRLDAATLLGRAGWKKAKPAAREKIALDYLHEIETHWEGSLTDDPAAPVVTREQDGGITVVAWIADPSGMRCGRTIHRMEYRFSDQGAVAAKQLESRDEGCD